MGFEDFELLAIAVVLVIVAVSYFVGKLGVAAPILLVVFGIGLSLIPGMPPIASEPELILTVVLPPLLYSAAVNMPVVDFRRDFGTIGALSVVLVLISAFGIGLLLWLIFPDLHLAAAIAVGAVVSPPDAVAATAKQVIDNPELRRRDGTRFDDDVIDQVRNMRARYADRDGSDARSSTMRQLRELEALVLEAEQDALREARSAGTFSSHAIERAQRRIDSGAMRLEHN
ncbi:cation:proton antiporter [uncultured Agrococcus sp.]|uniref:cation:proton antiporter domain-containing protein n=1 Tax=uncultured Agrococcus sp. TaxID=382258 RepID=UPI0025CFC9C7|nr:cation:proton antiporter [uncultured Agrococcus sp.]